ncbi:MAG: acyl-CoA thioesterase [Flavitalea sp.]
MTAKIITFAILRNSAVVLSLNLYMTIFTKNVSIRWSDLDPNFHLRHSVYYDLAAQQRIEVLQELGLTIQVMAAQHFGPVLFREECVFKKEIRLGQEVIINAKLAKVRADGSRWTIQQEFQSPDGTLLALLTVDGAWMDTVLRKIASPTPPIVMEVMNTFPKTDEFSGA